jgi:hypothetical protein
MLARESTHRDVRILPRRERTHSVPARGDARRGQDSLDEHSGGLSTPRTLRYFVLPVTVKWARLFFCQQSSLEAVQTGTSLP